MTPLAAYLLLFVAVGIGFIFVHLLAGKIIRPSKPDPAKRTIYECGEPTIGSAWVQFDLRFYVVALLFVIFDVEVAFFFPWAVVFGKANALAAVGTPTSADRYHATAERAAELLPPAVREQHAGQLERLADVRDEDVARLRELDARKQQGAELSAAEQEDWERLSNNQRTAAGVQAQARSMGWLALVDIAVFFGVLLVGFAYLWRRGDLAWVRSLAAERAAAEPAAGPPPAPVALAGTAARP